MIKIEQHSQIYQHQKCILFYFFVSINGSAKSEICLLSTNEKCGRTEVVQKLKALWRDR